MFKAHHFHNFFLLRSLFTTLHEETTIVKSKLKGYFIIIHRYQTVKGDSTFEENNILLESINISKKFEIFKAWRKNSDL